MCVCLLACGGKTDLVWRSLVVLLELCGGDCGGFEVMVLD